MSKKMYNTREKRNKKYTAGHVAKNYSLFLHYYRSTKSHFWPTTSSFLVFIADVIRLGSRNRHVGVILRFAKFTIILQSVEIFIIRRRRSAARI